MPPLGFAEGGHFCFKGGPNIFFADRSGNLAAAALGRSQAYYAQVFT